MFPTFNTLESLDNNRDLTKNSAGSTRNQIV